MEQGSPEEVGVAGPGERATSAGSSFLQSPAGWGPAALGADIYLRNKRNCLGLAQVRDQKQNFTSEKSGLKPHPHPTTPLGHGGSAST